MITSKYTSVKKQPSLKTLKTLPWSVWLHQKETADMMSLSEKYLWVPQGFGFSIKSAFAPSFSWPFMGPSKDRQASFERSCILWCDANETICDTLFLNFFFLYLHGLKGRLISTYQDTCFIYEKPGKFFRLEFIPEHMYRTFAKSRWCVGGQYSSNDWNRRFLKDTCQVDGSEATD